MMDKNELQEQLETTISLIGLGQVSPKDSGIGSMLKEMRSICMDTHVKMIAKYKPVADAYFTAHPNERKANLKYKIECELNRMSDSGELDFDEQENGGYLIGESRSHVMNTISDKIAKKKSAPKPPRDPNTPRIRDRRGYVFNGKTYGKGPLVLAVVSHYVENNDIDYMTLKKVFPDSLLKSYGIFKRVDEAREASVKRNRYFLKDTQLIQVSDDQIAVCNQFTGNNIGAFITKASSIGYEIKLED